MDRPVFVPLTPGLVVEIGGRRHRVTHVLTRDSILADDLETGKPERHRVSDIGNIPDEEADGNAPTAPDLAAVPDAAWDVAQRKFAVIEPLLDQPTRRRSDVEEAANAAGVHAGTVYEWISEFEKSGHLSSLLPRKAGRRTGTKLIDPRSEAILTASIRDLFLNKQQRLPSSVIEAVQFEARKAGLPIPHANTVRRRIRNLDPQDTMRRRGDRAGADRLRPAPGNYPQTSYPLQVVQIDHTPGDVIGVDDGDRLPLRRPWITLAIDVFTRLVVAIVAGYERPNAGTVGQCVSQIMLPKGPVLAALGIEGDWPVWGKPELILMDNAREFDSKTFKRACEAYKVGVEFRPVATPEYGGHVERLMLTTAQELRNIPGATFSNAKARGDYDSEKESIMTMDEIEAYLFEYFVNDYNARPHAGLDGMTPLAKFGAVMGGPDSVGTGIPEVPRDPARLRLDFLPAFERGVHRQGIRIDKVWYYDQAIAPYIDAKPSEWTLPNGKFVVRRDPRKISPIWFWDQRTGRHVPVHYANRTRPVISVWELRAAQAQLRAEGAANVDEEKLMRTHQRRQSMIADADAATRARRKDIRRDLQRRKETERAAAQEPGDVPNLRATARAAPPAPEPEEDIFAKPAVRPAVDLNPGRR